MVLLPICSFHFHPVSLTGKYVYVYFQAYICTTSLSPISSMNSADSKSTLQCVTAPLINCLVWVMCIKIITQRLEEHTLEQRLQYHGQLEVLTEGHKFRQQIA